MSLIIVKEPKLYCYPCKIRESYSANSKKLLLVRAKYRPFLNDLHLLGRKCHRDRLTSLCLCKKLGKCDLKASQIFTSEGMDGIAKV